MLFASIVFRASFQIYCTSDKGCVPPVCIFLYSDEAGLGNVSSGTPKQIDKVAEISQRKKNNYNQIDERQLLFHAQICFTVYFARNLLLNLFRTPRFLTPECILRIL